jgi:Lar family restriction alleviation protein
MNDQVTPLPCPFCGGGNIAVEEGSTFRWRKPVCTGCGAEGPEVRAQTMGYGTKKEWEAQAYADAIEVWNTRKHEGRRESTP